MQTHFPLQVLDTPVGREADRILRSCVHCGFCTATCPTYLLTGSELDSPRGRIYLVKQALEKNTASTITRNHLDRCLACQACETTCPSNVDYHRLLDIGRALTERLAPRSWPERYYRRLLLGVLGSRRLFAGLVGLGRVFRFLLPRSLGRQLPGKAVFTDPATPAYSRKVVLLDGCVQGCLSPDTNRAAALVLGRLGIAVERLPREGCCGAMHYHSNRQVDGTARLRTWLSQASVALANGAEAVISTASGCGNFIKDAPGLFIEDAGAREQAQAVVSRVMDIGEFLAGEDLSPLNLPGDGPLAFHSPCTLQHGQQLAGVTENLLRKLGFTIPAVANAHLCCGSAGTYSLFQPAMAKQLREQKLAALEKIDAGSIATANIGCQCHLAGGTDRPVRHWIEYVAQALQPAG